MELDLVGEGHGNTVAPSHQFVKSPVSSKRKQPTTRSSKTKPQKRGGDPIDILQDTSYIPEGMTTATATSNFRGQVDAEAVNALSIGQVAHQYGVTIDQLRNWDELGILTPSRVGSQRVYFREDLKRLDMIRGWMAEGYRPKEIRMAFELKLMLGRSTTSGTKALQQRIRDAKVGEWVQEPLNDKKQYNSAYRRLERGLKAAKRKHTPIRTSEDGKCLEARIIE